MRTMQDTLLCQSVDVTLHAALTRAKVGLSAVHEDAGCDTPTLHAQAWTQSMFSGAWTTSWQWPACTTSGYPAPCCSLYTCCPQHVHALQGASDGI